MSYAGSVDRLRTSSHGQDLYVEVASHSGTWAVAGINKDTHHGTQVPHPSPSRIYRIGPFSSGHRARSDRVRYVRRNGVRFQALARPTAIRTVAYRSIASVAIRLGRVDLGSIPQHHSVIVNTSVHRPWVLSGAMCILANRSGNTRCGSIPCKHRNVALIHTITGPYG